MLEQSQVKETSPMSWSKQEVLAFLDERPRVGRLATITPGGEPRVVPVWFRTAGDKVLVHTGAGMAKARNVEASGRYALAVDDDAWPYRGVSVWGPARLVDPEAAVGDLREFLTNVAVSYLGAEAGVPMGESLSDPSWRHTVIELAIERWISFDHAGYSARPDPPRTGDGPARRPPPLPHPRAPRPRTTPDRQPS